MSKYRYHALVFILLLLLFQMGERAVAAYFSEPSLNLATGQELNFAANTGYIVGYRNQPRVFGAKQSKLAFLVSLSADDRLPSTTVDGKETNLGPVGGTLKFDDILFKYQAQEQGRVVVINGQKLILENGNFINIHVDLHKNVTIVQASMENPLAQELLKKIQG